MSATSHGVLQGTYTHTVVVGCTNNYVKSTDVKVSVSGGLGIVLTTIAVRRPRRRKMNIVTSTGLGALQGGGKGPSVVFYVCNTVLLCCSKP
jgi:hypothetical protein